MLGGFIVKHFPLRFNIITIVLSWRTVSPEIMSFLPVCSKRFSANFPNFFRIFTVNQGGLSPLFANLCARDKQPIIIRFRVVVNLRTVVAPFFYLSKLVTFNSVD